MALTLYSLDKALISSTTSASYLMLRTGFTVSAPLFRWYLRWSMITFISLQPPFDSVQRFSYLLRRPWRASSPTLQTALSHWWRWALIDSFDERFPQWPISFMATTALFTTIPIYTLSWAKVFEIAVVLEELSAFRWLLEFICSIRGFNMKETWIRF